MNILAIFFATTFVEGLIEYVFGEAERAKPYLRYLALLAGVLFAVAYKIDIPSLVGLAAPLPLINYAVSGLIIGRGSNYVNDVISLIRQEHKNGAKPSEEGTEFFPRRTS